MSDNYSTGPITPAHNDLAKTQLSAAQHALQMRIIKQEMSRETFQNAMDQGAFNPTMMTRNFESLESKRKQTSKEEEAKKSEEAKVKITEVEKLDAIAEQVHRENEELQPRSLLLLRARIQREDTKEEILRKVLEMYPDHTLADEALDFLLKTTSGELAEKVRSAREDLNQSFGREVRAGKNIAQHARDFAKQGLGAPTALRDLYRDITGNPRDPNTLFNELTKIFEYEKLKVAIQFLMHSLGGDLKSKGPSIDRGELFRLLTETRKLQAILGVFRFFKSRMNLISSAFARGSLNLPSTLDFELLAKQYMRLVQDRYPSASKILQLAQQLGISEDLLAQIIIFTQMRDGVRQTAPKLFRNDQHRQDLLSSYIDALEELEEELEEEEEKEEEKEEEQ